MDGIQQPQGYSHFEEAVDFLEIHGTHFLDLGRMKGWFDLGATQWFWTRDTWIGRRPDLKIYRKHCTKN